MTKHGPGVPDISNLDRGVAERERFARAIDEVQARADERKKAEAKLTPIAAAVLSKAEFMRWKGSIATIFDDCELWSDVSPRMIDAMARKLGLMGEEERGAVMRKTILDGAKR